MNDTDHHARQLIRLLANIKVKINLIPFNSFPNTQYERSDWPTILRFRDLLLKSDIHTTIRKTRGDEFDGACGQLVGKVKDRTHRQARYLQKKVVGENP